MTPRFRLFSNDDKVSRQIFNIFLTLFQQMAGVVQGGNEEGENSDEAEASSGQGSGIRNVEEWMLICQHRAQLMNNGEASTETVDWLEAARRYPNLESAPSLLLVAKNHTHLGKLI